MSRSALRQAGRYDQIFRLASSPSRSFSLSPCLCNSDTKKPSIANIAELRKLMPGTSMIKAKEALTESSNNIKSALLWLEKDLQVTGAKKASKVSEREAKEGGVAVCIVTDGIPNSTSTDSQQQSQQQGIRFSPITLAARAGIVELNCETDFVGRNEIFQALLADLAHTVALFPTLAIEDSVSSSSSSSSSQSIIDISIAELLKFPLIPRPIKDQTEGSKAAPKTVGNAILDVISRLGERIHLARASSLSNVTIPSSNAPRRSDSLDSSMPWLVASSFAHGSSSNASMEDPQVSIGKVGSLLLTRIQRPDQSSLSENETSLPILRSLTRSLARQAAGMPTRSIEPMGTTEDAEESLYSQSFIMRLPASKLPNEVQGTSEPTVKQVLQAWGSAWTGQESSKAGEHIRVSAMRRWQLGEPFEAQK